MKCPNCSAELNVQMHELGHDASSARKMLDIKHPEPLCKDFDPVAVVESLVQDRKAARASKSIGEPAS